MIETDRRTRDRVETFRPSGVGTVISQNCDFCRKPKQQLGGKRFKRGPHLWMFKCADCRAAELKPTV